LRRYFAVSDRDSFRSPGIARVHDLPALLARAEADIDDVVRHANHVFVVLDDDHGVALVAELLQDIDEPPVVARMQADGRLVQYIECPDERRAERRREVDALRFAARQRGREPIERQVVEPDVVEKRQAAPDFAQHLVGHHGFLLAELEGREELLCLAHRERRHGVDRPAAHANVACLAAKPRTAAIGAGEVAAIAAQEHADVHLVLLPLEPPEEAADPVVGAIALGHERALVVGQLRPGDVEPGARFARRPFELRELRAIVGLAPRFDGALVDRLRRIRNDQIHVQLDDVAEPVAGRAGAERVVEREQPRLRRLVRDAAGAALETLRELDPGGIGDRGSGIKSIGFLIPDP
jgi:hypothetical protein